MLGNFACFFLSSAGFSKINIFKSFFYDYIRASNSLDPGQAQHVVGPDLDPNCFQR